MRVSSFLKKLSEDTRAAVEEFENTTAAELVVSIRRRSDDYYWPLVLPGMIMGAVFTWMMITDLVFSVSFILLISWITMAVTAILFFIPNVRKWLIRRSTRNLRVQEGALAAFSRNGVYKTEDREGILLYYSILERQAVCIADVGILGMLRKYDMEEALTRFRETLETNGHQAIPEAIQALGKELSKIAPPGKHRVNELGDAPEVM